MLSLLSRCLEPLMKHSHSFLIYYFKHTSIILKDHIKKIPHVSVHSILYRLAGNGTLSQTPLSETSKIITHENCDYRMCRNILDRIFMLVQDVLCVIYWWQIKNDNGNKMIPKHHTSDLEIVLIWHIMLPSPSSKFWHCYK